MSLVHRNVQHTLKYSNCKMHLKL